MLPPLGAHRGLSSSSPPTRRPRALDLRTPSTAVFFLLNIGVSASAPLGAVPGGRGVLQASVVGHKEPGDAHSPRGCVELVLTHRTLRAGSRGHCAVPKHVTPPAWTFEANSHGKRFNQTGGALPTSVAHLQPLPPPLSRHRPSHLGRCCWVSRSCGWLSSLRCDVGTPVCDRNPRESPFLCEDRAWDSSSSAALVTPLLSWAGAALGLSPLRADAPQQPAVPTPLPVQTPPLTLLAPHPHCPGSTPESTAGNTNFLPVGNKGGPPSPFRDFSFFFVTNLLNGS